MQQGFQLSRRRLLSRIGMAAGAYASSSVAAFAMHGGSMGGMKKMAPNWASPSFNPDVDIDLTCRPDEARIFDGPTTGVWRYVANLIKGPENSLTTLPDSYLGNVMRFWRGQKIRIRLHNGLSEPTIAHWHGLHVPMLMDGHPSYAIDPGETFVYEFEMRNRAGMYFYHPHPHEATATQVYRGLAGAILVNDDEEKALDLPAGEFEIPIVLQDRSFDDNNQLVYGGGMHGRMVGFQGDHILVNGRPHCAIDVASRAYRLRILNGSNSRIYKLAWDDASPITVIGVDGGLLERPEIKPYVMLAPGERLDVWADFSGRSVGSRLVMRSAPFFGVLPKMAQHMMGGMMMRSRLPVGGDYPLFTIRVARAVSDSPALPQRLTRIDRLRVENVANPNNPVPIAISEAPMAMLLNGRPYADDDAQPRERIPVDTLQLVEIFHDHGGMSMGRGMGMMGGMMSMAHPIHLHGQQFQILSRSADDVDPESYATMSEGFVGDGWKDTVLVTPGERVRIIKPFGDFKGAFMYHCHNLEHEDMGMMRQFIVE
jgi:FtsP/CotA-like multicopper oxidase with cupredoxin domain